MSYEIDLHCQNSGIFVLVRQLSCFKCNASNRHMYWGCADWINKADLNGDNLVQLYLASGSIPIEPGIALDSSGEHDVIIVIVLQKSTFCSYIAGFIVFIRMTFQ